MGRRSALVEGPARRLIGAPSYCERLSSELKAVEVVDGVCDDGHKKVVELEMMTVRIKKFVGSG
jgi:hypothetical protein